MTTNIPHDATPYPVRWHSNDRVQCAMVVKQGWRKLHLLVIDTPVRIVKVPLTEQRYISPLYVKGELYPARKALRGFRHAAQRLGATREALDYLNA